MSSRPSKEEIARRQYEAEHAQLRSSKSVVPYLVILVAAAFLLLLMAYLMQQRTADTVQGLHDSVNSVQTIDQLVVDNRALREQLEKLEAERDAVQQELDDLAAKAADAAREPTLRFNALNTLNQLRALYNQGKYKEAKTLLVANPTLEEDLRQVNAVLSDAELAAYDPLAAYQKLAKLLG